MVDSILYTPNFNFALPPFDYQRYQDLVNNNMRTADALLAKYIAVLNVQGVWENSTVYAVGDVTVDSSEGQLYRCLSAHTSPGAPTTFAQYRTNNPGVWTSATIGVQSRGAWATATAYALGDFVVSGQQYAVCTTAHTSGATFAGDAAYWDILLDLTTVSELKAINTQAGSYTLVLADANKLIKHTSATAVNLTIPPYSSVAFPERTQIMGVQLGAGQVTLVPGSGVSLYSENSFLKTNVQYSPYSLLNIGTNEWLVTGSLAP